MTWIEIIHLRATDEAGLGALVDELGRSLAREPVAITVYRHATVATDLSVHLVHETVGVAEPDRTLGQRLAATLEGYGLVDRSLWVEVSAPRASAGERRPS